MKIAEQTRLDPNQEAVPTNVEVLPEADTENLSAKKLEQIILQLEGYRFGLLTRETTKIKYQEAIATLRTATSIDVKTNREKVDVRTLEKAISALKELNLGKADVIRDSLSQLTEIVESSPYKMILNYMSGQ